MGGTAIRDSLASQVILSSADTLRRYSQYNETSYADFVRADAARLGVPRAMLPADARSLLLNLDRREDAQVGFHFAGEASFKAAKDGYGGSLILSNLNGYEVLAAGTQPTSGFNGASVYADDLAALDASRLVIGGVPAVQYGQTGNLVNFTGPNGAVAVRSELACLPPRCCCSAMSKSRRAPPSIPAGVERAPSIPVMAMSTSLATVVCWRCPTAG